MVLYIGSVLGCFTWPETILPKALKLHEVQLKNCSVQYAERQMKLPVKET